MNCRLTLPLWTVLAALCCCRVGLAEDRQGTCNESWRGRPVILDPRCQELPFTGQWSVQSLVALRDGSLLTVHGDATTTTRDEGRTWSPPRKIYDGPGPGVPSDACALLKTKAGALLMVYMDLVTMKWDWDTAKNEAAKDVRLDVWAIRSLDEGKTWIDRQKILDGYCGALIGMIQTSGGQIVAPMEFLSTRNRHCSITCVSADDGKTWRQGNVIDLGGRGDHDGATEPTVAELSNGRLLMFVRTNLDRFWEAYSDDQGRYWRELRPSAIDASSAPGYLIRLASGRLALAWNRLYPEGKQTATRVGGPGSRTAETPGSWHREELSLAFSADDDKTWTKPVVIARVPGGGLSYPFLFERKPGELWVITRFDSKVCLKLNEADFVRN
jgi:sialidase-1